MITHSSAVPEGQTWAYKALQAQMDLDALEPLPPLDHLAHHFQYMEISKGHHYLMQGSYEERIAFVAKGIFRYYYLTPQGEDITKHFSAEKSFVCSYAAMIYQRPSAYGIVAEEDAVVLVIHKDQYLQLIEVHRSWERMARKYTEHIYNMKELREASLLLLDAKQRYREFMAQYPDLAGRLKQRHIATYLGIHPVSLSRISKALKQEGKVLT